MILSHIYHLVTDWLDSGPKDLRFYFLDYINSVTLFENLDFVGVSKVKTLAWKAFPGLNLSTP